MCFYTLYMCSFDENHSRGRRKDYVRYKTLGKKIPIGVFNYE